MREASSSFRWVTVLAGIALLAACTGGSPSNPRGSTPPGVPTASPAESFVRTCEASVYGDLGKGWRKGALVISPIAFVGLPGASMAPRQDFAPLEDGFRSVKALAVVEEGSEVTVSVAPVDRPHVSLLYDPAAFKDVNSYQISDGETAVTFRACSSGESPFGVDGPTQFNGGFIVDGSLCATLQVQADPGPPEWVDVAFGKGSCP